MLTVGSLFSGIGGLELGVTAALARVGVHSRIAWQAEINPYARAVLAKHWPDTLRFEDVRHVDAGAPPVDLVCGGFPCQDLSIAGKRAGIDGARSGLWSEFARVVRVLRPRYVVVENVPELLAYLGRVLGPLAALGYDAVWDVFSAAEVGAPHLRERLFILAYTDGDRIGDAFKPLDLTERGDAAGAGDDGSARPLAHADGVRPVRAIGEGEVGSAARQRAPVPAAPRGGSALADALQPRRPRPEDGPHEGRQRPAVSGRWWEAEPDVGRVVDGAGTRLDARRRRARLRGLGNGVVPQQAAIALVTLAARAGLIGGTT